MSINNYNNNCSECYSITLPECFGTFIIDAGLDALTEYTWFITDKFGNRYYKKFTADGDGLFEIAETDFPEGVLNHAAGLFELTIKKNYSDCEPLELEICSETFHCIQIVFNQAITAGTDEEETLLLTIPCNCADRNPCTMIELFTFCLLTSLAIQAIYISIHWPGMILYWFEPYTYLLPDWLGKPLFNCPICMASFWTIAFFLALRVGGSPFRELEGAGWLLAILITAGINAILSQLIELLRLLINRINEE